MATTSGGATFGDAIIHVFNTIYADPTWGLTICAVIGLIAAGSVAAFVFSVGVLRSVLDGPFFAQRAAEHDKMINDQLDMIREVFEMARPRIGHTEALNPDGRMRRTRDRILDRPQDDPENPVVNPPGNTHS